MEGPIVPVICPTRDEQGLVARSVAVIWNVLYELGRRPFYIHVSCVGYSKVRTDAFVQAKKDVSKALGEDIKIIRGIMIDDDILVTDQNALYKAIITADRANWNIVAPYRTKKDQIVLCKGDGTMLSIEEYKKLKPYDRISLAGLGFYYGDLPLDYEFHSDGKPFLGEDLNFFYDNPQLQPRVAPIPLKHLKVMPI